MGNITFLLALFLSSTIALSEGPVVWQGQNAKDLSVAGLISAGIKFPNGNFNVSLTPPTLTGSAVLTLPGTTDTLVGRATVDTLTNKTLTAPAITGGSALQLTDLTIKDTNTTGFLRFLVDSGMTAAATRNLTFNMNDASHIITLSNDLTLNRGFTVSGTGNVTLTSTGTTGVTLPTTGTLATLAGVETLTNKTLGSTNTITGATAASFTNGAATVTLPSSTSTLDTLALASTLTNKTINGSSNTLTVLAGSQLSGQVPPANGGTGQNSTATFPTSGVVVTEGATETLSNKTLLDGSTIIANTAAQTKQFIWDLSGATAGNTLTLAAVHTANRVVTLPNATDTLIGKNTSDSLTNKTMGSTNVLTGATATSFTGAGASTITMPTSTSTMATLALAETLTNKTMGSTNTLTGATASNFTNTGTISLPSATSTLATLALAETLTNKTLGSTNTLTGATAASFTNTGTVTLPSSTDTLVARNTSDTLTNKTISGASNTITNVSLTSGVTGSLPTGNGGTNKATWTAGSIPYLTSTTAFSEDNSNLFWDGTNHRLGLGTATPQKMLESSASSAVVQWRLTDTAVAHGITTGLATTTIAQIGDASVDGGIEIDGFAQSTTQAMIHKATNVTASTTIPVMEFRAGKKSGTTTGNAAASDMIYSFAKNDGTALVTMTGDGVENFTAGLKIAGSSTLGTFTRGSKSTAFQSDGTGSVATAAVTVQYYRIDDWVTVFFPSLTFPGGPGTPAGYIGTGGPSNINNLTAVDSFIRPATTTQEALCVPWTLGTTKQAPVGRMLISTAGTFTLDRDNAATSFPNADNTTATNVTTTNPFSCSYYVGAGS